MAHIRQGKGRAAADTTGWLLGTIIVVLAVLDLLIWATLWNVPNPVSKWLAPQALGSRPAMPVSFAGRDEEAQPAVLRGGAPRALPRSREQ